VNDAKYEYRLASEGMMYSWADAFGEYGSRLIAWRDVIYEFNGSLVDCVFHPRVPVWLGTLIGWGVIAGLCFAFPWVAVSLVMEYYSNEPMMGE